MKKVLVTWVMSLVVLPSAAQSVDEVKLGMGASFLGTGDMLIGKLEGEATRRWNRIISNSASLGIGYGGSKFYIPPFRRSFFQRTFTTHLDGNVFVSPFGNDRTYNFKLGTGLSLMYVSDNPEQYNDRWREERVSLGLNVIMEHEVTVVRIYLIGLKMMMQPYLNGDIAHTLLLKFGRKL